MKKLLSFVIMVSLFAFITITASAAFASSVEHKNATIFAADSIVKGIKENLDEQQVQKFFDDKEVILDFEHVIPVYMFLIWIISLKNIAFIILKFRFKLRTEGVLL